ncbi:MAG TPA: hypothetical protein VHX38_41690 [Pseudonocardiaceae bacterium]|jgi:hypothetical protein|nr:hypothetical protein [Pseudonocardiaceae bacterium]
MTTPTSTGPTDTDPRARDVAEARLLFAQARERGSIPLPQLTDLDLCVFRQSFGTLLDEDVWGRWCALDEGQQQVLADQSFGFLEFRRLLRPIDPTGTNPDYYIQPKLGAILLARQAPTVLGVCSVPGQLRVGDLRMFAFTATEDTEPIVVLERTTARGLGDFGRVRQYVLAIPEAAGGAAADWVRESFAADQGAAGRPRYVTFYRHPDDEAVSGERFSLTPADGGFQLSGSNADHVVEQRTFAEYVAHELRTAQ